MKAAQLTALVTVMMITLFSASAHAEEVTLKVLAPWQGHGQVYKVAPNKVKVVGSFDGIMYIDNGKGDLDAAVMMCPGCEYIDINTKQTTIKADCIITKNKEKVAYATLNATGKIGGARGKFEIVGGEGKWKGISGKGDIVIRTALGALAVNKTTGAVVDAAAGLAVWPALKVKLPARK